MPLDYILIDKLKIDTVIGCLAWERQILHPLLLDLKIYVDLSHAGESDQLTDTLNYAELCQYISQVVCERKAQLIEHVAYVVMKALMQRFAPIQQIEISVHKPAIIKQAQSIAIHMQRTRQQLNLL